ncbi:MAG: hypothetical protein C4518_04885 [Desulfobacteraceae bacterium]|nr:MAG: hypothetical protein C4518_04885 [Desulfobacteraceae bacterium]
MKKEDTTLPVIPSNEIEVTEIEEVAADELLVKQAYEKVYEITVRYFTKSMYEVGEYLIKEFYGDDYKRAQDNKPVKKHSLNQFFEKLNQGDPGSPKKTWIYNAINLVIDEHYFEEIEFSVYGKLGQSHKVYLTHVMDVEAKKMLISEAVDNKYTVAQLKKRISAIKNPEKEKMDRKVRLNLDKLSNKDTLRLQSLEKLEKKAGLVDKEIDSLRNRLKEFEAAGDALKSVIEEKEKQKKAKAEKAKQKKPKAENASAED